MDTKTTQDSKNTITSLTGENISQDEALINNLKSSLKIDEVTPLEEATKKQLDANDTTTKITLDPDIELEEIKEEAEPLPNASRQQPTTTVLAEPEVELKVEEEDVVNLDPKDLIQTKANEEETNSKKPIKLAINGFGRIGRQFFKAAIQDPNIEVVAINDLAELNNLAYLLKYDTIYGNYDKEVTHDEGYLTVESKKIKFLQEKDPNNLPWKDLNIDVVVESTGFFTSTEKASAHLNAGAKRVVISAPAKDEETPTVTPNNNIDALEKAKITSNASCTTNAATPLATILDLKLGIESALLNTIHGYTSTQATVDGPSQKDFRRGRTAAQNIIPTSSGAALATAKVLPQMSKKMDAMAMRVPVPSGSILDFTFVSKKETTVEEVNNIFKEACETKEWKGIVTFTEEPLVSTDILKNPHGSIVDLALTRVVNKNLVKVCAWYDNEWGYVNMLLKHVLLVGKLI